METNGPNEPSVNVLQAAFRLQTKDGNNAHRLARDDHKMQLSHRHCTVTVQLNKYAYRTCICSVHVPPATPTLLTATQRLNARYSQVSTSESKLDLQRGGGRGCVNKLGGWTAKGDDG